MMNRIAVTYEDGKDAQHLSLTLHIKRCILAALREEKVRVPCEINVLVTNNQTIRVINKQYRKVDSATDVLSFPMFQFRPDALPEDFTPYIDRETGLLPLGDMAISLERAKQQAAEFGHSVKREVGYLTIHSVLHLLGYDHMDEGEMKKQMRAREDAICASIELTRDSK